TTGLSSMNHTGLPCQTLELALGRDDSISSRRDSQITRKSCGWASEYAAMASRLVASPPSLADPAVFFMVSPVHQGPRHCTAPRPKTLIAKSRAHKTPVELFRGSVRSWNIGMRESLSVHSRDLAHSELLSITASPNGGPHLDRYTDSPL